ncbi:MAG: YicC family protein, partial [Oscillospiraceae bacterium]|nr:YicC family protein [Oscillospiraceae bacterium]
KVEVGLQVQNISAEDTTVSVNMDLARGYLAAMQTMAAQLGIKDDVTANSMARFSDIFATRKNEQDEELIWQDIQSVLNEAIEKFVSMRAVEGEKLKEDVLGRLVTIESTLTILEQTSAERVEKYTEKMYARLKTLLEDVVIDETRVLTEAAIFADKTAVDEETVRLRSHIKQYREILEAGGPVGRKLDFLTQEINREVNTIGSKAQELAITRMVVEMKAEIEKIREQIQNME